MFGKKSDSGGEKAKHVADYSALDDPGLLELCARKDEEAFSEIVGRYEKFVYSAVFSELRHEDDAFDVSQEVFIRLWNAAGGFRCESTLKTWLYRMCKNCAYDYMRKHYKHKALSLTKQEDDEESTVEDIAADSTPEEEAIRQERVKAVRKAIAALPEEQRDVIVLREIQDMSYTEIAASLGISEGTVKSRISRGREALKKALTGFI